MLDNPGTGVPLHVHSHENEVFHVLEGKVEFSLPDKIFVGGPGTTVFLPIGLPHAFKVVGNKQARVLFTIFPAGLEKMFMELSELKDVPPTYG